MSEKTMTAEQAQIQILSEEYAAQVAELTRRVSALRVEVLQYQQALNGANEMIAELQAKIDNEGEEAVEPPAF